MNEHIRVCEFVVRENAWMHACDHVAYVLYVCMYTLKRWLLVANTNIILISLQIQQFNAANRFTKKGLAVVPMKYGITAQFAHYGLLLNIDADGTVQVCVCMCTVIVCAATTVCVNACHAFIRIHAPTLSCACVRTCSIHVCCCVYLGIE